MEQPSQDGRKFVESVRNDLSATMESILNHPYLNALEKKELSKQSLGRFVCEQYHIISNDRRNFAFMAAKASSDTTARLFADGLINEIDALNKLLQMAEELDIIHDKIESYEPLAGCNAYTNYLTRLAVYGSDEEILLAVLVDFPVWGTNCGKMAYLLKRNYGFSNEACVFLENFSKPLPEEFVDKSCELIQRGLHIREKELRRAARLILDYELLFWDTIYQHSTNH
jgi:thiaminase